MNYAIKATISEPHVSEISFSAAKTMYGGKAIAEGDTIYLFDNSRTPAGGLFARAEVVTARAVPRRPGIARQTPRVDVTLRLKERARRPLSRDDLKGYKDWNDGKPQTELNFKFYRQATDKIAGLSDETARFLDTFF